MKQKTIVQKSKVNQYKRLEEYKKRIQNNGNIPSRPAYKPSVGHVLERTDDTEWDEDEEIDEDFEQNDDIEMKGYEAEYIQYEVDEDEDSTDIDIAESSQAEGSINDDSDDEEMYTGKETHTLSQAATEITACFGRPDIPESFILGSDVVFQLIDMDYTVKDTETFIRLFGVTNDRNSVTVIASGFLPYMYFKVHREYEKEELSLILNNLNAWLSRTSSKPGRVVSCTCARKLDIYGYRGPLDKKIEERLTFKDLDHDYFIKIEVHTPNVINPLRQMFEKGECYTNGLRMLYPDYLYGPISQDRLTERAIITYESNVPFVLRAMIDSNAVGAGWVRIPKDKYDVMMYEHNNISTSQIECYIEYENIEFLDYQMKEYSIIAPLRTVSFDIETIHRDDKNKDSVPFPYDKQKHTESDGKVYEGGAICTMIACSMDEHGLGNKNLPFDKVVFGHYETDIKTVTDRYPKAKIFIMDSEQNMLLAFSCFMRTFDPDIITGYNTGNYDFPFIMGRSHVLGIYFQFAKLGRLKRCLSYIRTSVFESKAFGKKESFRTMIYGRWQLDFYEVAQRDFKFSSYTLNNVALALLGVQKDDVHHTQIKQMTLESAKSCARITNYCIRDSELPLNMLKKRLVVTNYIEMARVTGIPPSFILEKGQQIKVSSLILRYTLPLGGLSVVQLRVEGLSGIGFKGARVIEPKAGFYDVPIATLDFASLYPSIMITKNLCYMTMLTKEQAKRLEESNPGSVFYTYLNKEKTDYHCSVKPFILEGMLPSILRMLLSKRKVAKGDMGKAEDTITLIDKCEEDISKCERDIAQREKEIREHNNSNSDGATGSEETLKEIEELQQKMDDAQKKLNEATEPGDKAYWKQIFDVMNGRQNALKTTANSVYGFTGAVEKGRMPMKSISECVTYTGAEMLFSVEASVILRFSKCEENPDHTVVVIYGDTDSVMVKFGQKGVAECMQLGKLASAYITTHLFKKQLRESFKNAYNGQISDQEVEKMVNEDPVKLEFEKVYYPYLLVGKKMYAGGFWTKPDKPDKLDIKGLKSARRDTSKFLKELELRALKIAILGNNLPLAMISVAHDLKMLQQQRVPLNELIASKKLSKNPEEYTSNIGPHVHLARKRGKNNPDLIPRAGERIYYVIRAGNKSARLAEKVRERAVEPDEFMKTNMELDIDYYMTSVKKEMFKIMLPMIGNKEQTDALFAKKYRVITTSSAKTGITPHLSVQSKCISCKATDPTLFPTQKKKLTVPPDPSVNYLMFNSDVLSQEEYRKALIHNRAREEHNYGKSWHTAGLGPDKAQLLEKYGEGFEEFDDTSISDPDMSWNIIYPPETIKETEAYEVKLNSTVYKSMPVLCLGCKQVHGTSILTSNIEKLVECNGRVEGNRLKCMECQGGQVHAHPHCSNIECAQDLFYKRKSDRRDREKQEIIVKNLLEW